MIEGLSHLTFIVRDLEKMSDVIIGVLGGREIYSSGDATFSTSREKFFLVHGIWLAAMEGEPLPTRSYNHIAFKVRPEDLPECKRAIDRLGLEMREARPRVEGEGHSIYFYDFDNHLFELHTGTLEERLARYAKGRAA
jgi:catechol 2,3-dioxygenase-like lactoylglutathione lyase family enzyme